MTAPTNPRERHLQDSLRRLHELQARGHTAIRSEYLKRREREALVDAGHLLKVLKGWYLPSRPGDALGGTTQWFAATRDFVIGYCNARFGHGWHISPALSLLVHAGKSSLPKQVIIHSPSGINNTLGLPAGCSLLTYKTELPPDDQIEVRDGLRVLALPVALTRAPEHFFQTSASDAQIALVRLSDTSKLNRLLVAGRHSVVAGRLAGALRAIGRPAQCDEVLGAMREAGFTVQESNPFLAPRRQSPRIR